MKGYLITIYDNMGKSYITKRLIEEAEKSEIDIEVIGVRDSILSQGEVIHKGKILEKCDFVINRFKQGIIKDYINNLGRKSYNNLASFNKYINKYEQLKDLSDCFLYPEYILASSSLEIDKIIGKLGMPFVAKGLESSQGREVRLIKNNEDYLRLSEDFPENQEFLFEEFIKTSNGRDMRFFVIDGEIIAGMERISKGDFRCNFALGAEVKKISPDDYIRKIARDIYKKTNLDFFGLDLLYGIDRPVFCEINVMPGIEGMEKSNDLNIAGMIIEKISKDLKQD